MLNLDHLSISARIAAMRQVASSKVNQANGSPAFLAEIEANLDTIAMAHLAKMAPINVNLLGLSMMLLAEVKRLKGT